MKDFIMNNMELIGIIGGFLIGWFLPSPKVNKAGRVVGEKLPEKLKMELANKLDAFEQGLRGQEYNGDSNVVSNEQLSQSTEKLRVDLGLKDSKSEQKA